MGRPINKRFFGQPTADTDNKIEVIFNAGTGNLTGWIVRQRGTNKFLVSDGTTSAICRLVDPGDEALAEGQMTINALLPNNEVVRIVKIAANKMTSDEGMPYVWNFEQDDTAEIAAVGFFSDTVGVAPAGTIVFTAGDEIVTDTTAEVPFTYNLEDQTEFEYQVDGSAWISLAASPVMLAGLEPLTSYQLSVRAVNDAGVGATETTTVTTTA